MQQFGHNLRSYKLSSLLRTRRKACCSQKYQACLQSSSQSQRQCWAVQSLSQQFPESDWIVAQAAVAQYNLRNFDGAQELFEDLIERDPHRVEVILLPTHFHMTWTTLHSISTSSTPCIVQCCFMWCILSVGPLLGPRRSI